MPLATALVTLCSSGRYMRHFAFITAIAVLISGCSQRATTSKVTPPSSTATNGSSASMNSTAATTGGQTSAFPNRATSTSYDRATPKPTTEASSTPAGSGSGILSNGTSSKILKVGLGIAAVGGVLFLLNKFAKPAPLFQSTPPAPPKGPGFFQRIGDWFHNLTHRKKDTASTEAASRDTELQIVPVDTRLPRDLAAGQPTTATRKTRDSETEDPTKDENPNKAEPTKPGPISDPTGGTSTAPVSKTDPTSDISTATQTPQAATNAGQTPAASTGTDNTATLPSSVASTEDCPTCATAVKAIVAKGMEQMMKEIEDVYAPKGATKQPAPPKPDTSVQVSPTGSIPPT